MIKERILVFLPSRKNLTIGLAVLVLVTAGFLVSNYLLRGRIVSKEFIGSIQKVEGNTIFLQGLYIVPEKPEIMKEQNGFTQNVEVTVDGNTEIAKTLMHMPTARELANTNGTWDPNKLKKEEVKGTVAEMTDKKQGLIIRVLANDNIFKKTSFTAKRIEFTEPVYSE